MFLVWYNDNPKQSIQAKIGEAIAAYVGRFGTQPNIVLVNAAEAVTVEGIEVRPRPTVGKSNFWVSREEG